MNHLLNGVNRFANGIDMDQVIKVVARLIILTFNWFCLCSNCILVGLKQFLNAN